MADPYVGEIRMFAGFFNPMGWEFCNGQMLPIAENETLFQLIGTRFGGDGESSFGLPNLQSRVPIHFGTGPDGINYPINPAQMAGTETVTLTNQQMPVHSHPIMVANSGQTKSPSVNTILAAPTGNVQGIQAFAPTAANTQLEGLIGPAGGSQPHDNMQPYLVIRYIISLYGIFPSPS